MRRGPSSITLVAGATTIILVLSTVYVLWRPSGSNVAKLAPPSRESPSMEERAADPPAGPSSMGSAMGSAKPIRGRPEPRATEPSEASPDLPTTAAAVPAATAPVFLVDAAPAPADGAVSPVPLRRALVVAAHNQILKREADERVFESRKLSESTRVAIRKMNATLAEETRLFLSRSGAATDAGRGAASPEAEQRRHVALEGVLGPEEARAFEVAERIAARALVPRYRRQWSRELHESGTPIDPPLPP